MTNLDKLIEAIEAGRDFGSLLDNMPREWWPHIVGAYKGSLDAAKALHDALLPGWDIQISIYEDDSFEASVARPLEYNTFDGISHLMSRAWLIAILKVYRAQVQG